MADRSFASSCYAPFASLYLDPRGEVRVCCMNQYQRLGNIASRSLRGIWDGPELAELRSRLAVGDLSLGCDQCQVHLDAGSPGTAYLRVFDQLCPDSPSPRWPEQLELALSNTCNLQCVMCNGDLSSSIRAHREKRPPLAQVYGDAFFEQLDEFLPHLRSVVFLGGEPFLGRETLRVMDRLIDLGLTPRCHITTNGTQWGPRIRRIVTGLPVHVAISIDAATAATTASIRVGADHARIAGNVRQIRDTARAAGSDCSISFSLQRANVREFGAALAWADGLDLDVAVNTVSYPPAFSLQLLGAEELDAVVAALRAEDRVRKVQLGRNLAVWSSTVAMVSAMCDHRAATPVVIGRDRKASARALVARHADERGVGVIGCDENQLIRRVSPDPADVLGIDFRPYLGRSSVDLVDVFMSAFGRTESTHLLRHDNGLEERDLVFRGSDGIRTRLRAVLVETGNGQQQWFVGARQVRSS
jgi:MoaA/NifB/PqqE/SkfB family radical SAM enzyme